MDKRYYTEYYTLERGHWWFKIRALILDDFVKRNVGNAAPLKILNVGVATGSTSEMLNKYGQVTSVEYDKDCCEFLRTELKMEVINASVEDLPFDDNTYDLVCAFDVIEHVENEMLAVQEMKRVCKPSGIVFVSVPAFMVLWNHHDVVNHHHKRYTLPEIKKLFAHSNGNGKEHHGTYFNTLLFVPIFIYRRISKLFERTATPDDSGSDFGALKNGVLNTLFYNFFRLEVFWLRVAKFPFGVSLMYSWKKSR
jgi:2-polyprenyl-3-methyl-5-hydroxy-6-metoxy-1,4-benzoquinol methylase